MDRRDRGSRLPHGPAARLLAFALGLAVLGWALPGLPVASGDGGPVTGLIALGGWGLSLLPVHCAPWRRRTADGRGRTASPAPRRRCRNGRFRPRP
ncbi:hypothetical protein ACFP1Z_31650 [Streptomyces gamaensis]|uniref:Uncharacterized protein n=1 Tax=Streptomyces gamaensis TaxID=1763542 RepID=A0ABW0ZCM0_9ACTN